MFKGDWLSGDFLSRIAGGILVASAILYGVSEYNSQPLKHQNTNEAPQTAANVSSVKKDHALLAAGKIESTPTQGSSQSHKTKDQSECDGLLFCKGWLTDIAAQWLMAICTALITIFTFVGLIFIMKTYKQADNTAKAAWKTVDETKRIGEAQTRAYISLVDGEFFPRANDILCRVKLNNTGNSPARNILFYPVHAFFPSEEIIFVRNKGIEGCVDIAGGREGYLDVFIENISNEILDHVESGRGGLIVLGNLRYIDIFGDRQKHVMAFSVASRCNEDIEDKILPENPERWRK